MPNKTGISNFNVIEDAKTLTHDILVLRVRDSHNSSGLPIVSESFSSNNTCFFVTINFEASYLAFLYKSLSRLNLDFLNFLKCLSVAFSFSKTSLSNN